MRAIPNCPTDPTQPLHRALSQPREQLPFDKGLNANMCDRFVELIEAAERQTLRIEFSWSKDWRLPPDIDGADKFEVKSQYIEILRNAADKMRVSNIDHNQTIIGRVFRLSSEANPSDLLDTSGEREIAVSCESDSGNIMVNIQLSPEDYLLAVQAHKDGRPVSARGELYKEGRKWVGSSWVPGC